MKKKNYSSIGKSIVSFWCLMCLSVFVLLIITKQKCILSSFVLVPTESLSFRQDETYNDTNNSIIMLSRLDELDNSNNDNFNNDNSTDTRIDNNTNIESIMNDFNDSIVLVSRSDKLAFNDDDDNKNDIDDDIDTNDNNKNETNIDTIMNNIANDNDVDEFIVSKIIMMDDHLSIEHKKIILEYDTTVTNRNPSQRYLYKPFPRWEFTATNDNSNSSSSSSNSNTTRITIPLLMSFLQQTFVNESISTIYPQSRRKLYTELFYIMDRNGIYTSTIINERTSNIIHQLRNQPWLYLMNMAFDVLKKDYITTKNDSNYITNTRWQRLKDVLFTNDRAGIPFFSFLGDYGGCGYHNLQMMNDNSTYSRVSLPLFTVAAKLDCNHSLPIPTYKTIEHSFNDTKAWDRQMKQWNKEYPYDKKIQKAVWRGGLTGPLNQHTSPRWRLPYYTTVLRNTSLFDVGITDIPRRHKDAMKQRRINVQSIGGLVPKISPMEDYQKYLAIIDTDGNSWSSRFGKLLCYNSVILKVDAKFVDYFYYPHGSRTYTASQQQHTRLIPWYHYIPVHYNLSNLMEQTQFALNPNNKLIVTSIINNANQWCKQRMIIPSLAEDVLDIFNTYVSYLDASDSNWMNEWKHEKYNLFHNINNNNNSSSLDYGMQKEVSFS